MVSCEENNQQQSNPKPSPVIQHKGTPIAAMLQKFQMTSKVPRPFDVSLDDGPFLEDYKDLYLNNIYQPKKFTAARDQSPTSTSQITRQAINRLSKKSSREN